MRVPSRGLLVVVLLSGCFQANKEARFADLRRAASFDLSCPQTDLTISPLGDASELHGGGRTGAAGCGKKAAYLWDDRNQSWVKNSESVK
jgi:hypothetical protein